MICCYTEIIITISISFLLDLRPSYKIMSSFARKFGMSHLVPTETFSYPTGQHQHHVQSDFSQSYQQNHHQLNAYHNQEHHHMPYQKQNYQQKQHSSLKMEATINDNNTSMPIPINSRVGKYYI